MGNCHDKNLIGSVGLSLSARKIKSRKKGEKMVFEEKDRPGSTTPEVSFVMTDRFLVKNVLVGNK